MVVDSYRRYEGGKEVGKEGGSDILSAHPASFTHNFVSGMQIFFISASPRVQWYCKLIMKK